MKTNDVLNLWDKLFPDSVGIYPAAWVIRMWCSKYELCELEFGANVALRAMKDGRLSTTLVSDVSKYISGVLRAKKSEDVKVEAEIAQHIDQQLTDRIGQELGL